MIEIFQMAYVEKNIIWPGTDYGLDSHLYCTFILWLWVWRRNLKTVTFSSHFLKLFSASKVWLDPSELIYCNFLQNSYQENGIWHVDKNTVWTKPTPLHSFCPLYQNRPELTCAHIDCFAENKSCMCRPCRWFKRLSRVNTTKDRQKCLCSALEAF